MSMPHLPYLPHKSPYPGRLSVLLAIAGTLLLLAACGGNKESAPAASGGSTPVASSAPAPSNAAAASAAVSSDPETAVRAALKLQVTAAPYHVTNKLISEGSTSTQTIDYVSPQELAMSMGGMELRLVGGKAYQMVDGKWQENASMAAIGDSVAEMYSAENFDTMIGTLSNVRATGTEDINGDSARIYEYNSANAMGGVDVKSTHKLWVREKDGLPVKQVADTEMSGVKSTTETTVVYDPALKVTAPD